MTNGTSSASPRDFFSKHAEAYSKSKSHAEGSDLARSIEIIQPKSSDSVLDLATGTGFTAMEFALRVEQVTAVDITREMVWQARKLARDRGIRNIEFELADVSSLPFAPDSFDIVATRRARHHFNDVPRALIEGKEY